MSDVLLLFVRQDSDAAETLADLFDSAGFSICERDVDETELAAASAVVALISAASLRCESFRAKARRALALGNAVPGRLDGATWEGASYDLRHWNGDPDEPAVDPLFFAVDRKIMAARRAAERAAQVKVVALPMAVEPVPTVEPKLAPITADDFDTAWRAALEAHPGVRLKAPEPKPARKIDVPYWQVRTRPRPRALHMFALFAVIGAAALTASLNFAGGARDQAFATPAAAASELSVPMQPVAYAPPAPAIVAAAPSAQAPMLEALTSDALPVSIPIALDPMPDPKAIEVALVTEAEAAAPRAKKNSA